MDFNSSVLRKNIPLGNNTWTLSQIRVVNVTHSERFKITVYCVVGEIKDHIFNYRRQYRTVQLDRKFESLVQGANLFWICFTSESITVMSSCSVSRDSGKSMNALSPLKQKKPESLPL